MLENRTMDVLDVLEFKLYGFLKRGKNKLRTSRESFEHEKFPERKSRL